MVCYSFPVRLFHSPLHAGLSRRSGCPGFFVTFCTKRVDTHQEGEKRVRVHKLLSLKAHFAHQVLEPGIIADGVKETVTLDRHH